MPDLRSQLDALRRKLAEETKALNRATTSNPLKAPTGALNEPNQGLLHSQQVAKADNTIEARPTIHAPKPIIPNYSDAVKNEKRPRLDVVIGLDFGTRFTKVAYRVVGVERTHIVVPNIANPESALLKSVVFVDTATMTIHRKRPKGSPGAIVELPYLKLLLKDINQPITLVPPMLRKTVDADSIKVISAFYLSDVLQSTLIAIAQKEETRLKGRQVVYALNVSLPADHCDDAATEVFKEVAAVAFRWAQSSIGMLGQATLTTLSAAYDAEALRRPSEFEVSVFPEIIAALYHFIMRRDTPSGIHGFLDIGGGTIDGCIFDMQRERTQSVQVKVLAAKVTALGTIVVAKKALGILYANLERSIEAEIVTRSDVNINVPLPLEKVDQEIGNFIGQLLVAAQANRRGRILIHDEDAVFDTEDTKRELAKSFLVHMTGGGAKSGWYREATEKVHRDRNLASHGIMHYRCALLQPPQNFDSTNEAPFERFVIAHGLTMDAANLENLKTKLPSQLRGGIKLPDAAPVLINYADTKDAWT